MPGILVRLLLVWHKRQQEENNIVIELSSFQLMGIDTFTPKIAIITNLYDAHLDYHSTREEYVQAKANITKNQTEADYLIVNAEQHEVMNIADTVKGHNHSFFNKKEFDEGAYISDGWICFNGEKVMQMDEIAFQGSIILKIFYLQWQLQSLSGVENEAIQEVLRTFTGVKTSPAICRRNCWEEVL